MKKVIALALTSCAFVIGGLTTQTATAINRVVEEKDTRIIVQLKEDSYGKTRDYVLATQNMALAQIKNTITPYVEVKERFTNVLNAFVLEVPSAYVNGIRNLSCVKDVNYDQLHCITEQDGYTTLVAEGTSDLEKDNVSIETMNVPEESNEGEGILIGILDSGFLLNHYDEKTDKTYTHETFTDLGNDVKVKLTAADVAACAANDGFHAQPDTDHTTYYSKKVPFYYDYGGMVRSRDEYDGEHLNGDYDVYSPVSDHGLHVASIAAGNAPEYKGVAPKAQLALMKVFTDYIPNSEDKAKGYTNSSGAFDSAILLALEDAAILKCDVLNMSFGSNLDDFDSDTIVQKTLATLKEKGIYSNYAAGNAGKGYYALSGPYSSWTGDMIETGILSGSANNEAVMTVAASQATRQFYETALVVNGFNIDYADQIVSNSSTTYETEYRLSDLIVDGNTEFDWVRIPNLGANEDYNGLDVNNKIAIVDRGELTFVEKISNAVNHGACAVAIINNDPTDTDFTFRMALENYTPVCPVILILNKDSDKFIGSGKLQVLKDVVAANPSANEMASFTSDGPTYDFRLKPEISTPGHVIRGAVSEDANGNLDATKTNTYDFWSGTSMATPNYTGVVALLLGEHTNEVEGKLVVDPDYFKTVNARAMSTANPRVDAKGVTASVRIQGAGLVDVEGALNSDVYFETKKGSGKAKVELFNNEDIAKGLVKLAFSATNDSDTAITYNVTTKVYRPDYYIDSDEEFASTKLQSILDTEIASATSTITINPGDNNIVIPDIQISAEEIAEIEEGFDYACPLEGYATFEAEGKETLNIPFLGYYGDVESAIPVEPFSFEKEAGKTYPSDILDDVCSVLGYSNTTYASEIVTGYFDKEVWGEDYEGDSPLTDYVYNTSTIYGIKGSDNKSCSRIKAVKGENDRYTLYTTNNTVANTMIIQQYVMRSVATNVLTIEKKSNKEVILTDHMFDMLYGGDENYELRKSFVDDNYISNGIIASRAYTIIGLWNSETQEDYADGEYTLNFDYTLTDGTHYKKSYDFVIESKIPEVKSAETVTNNGQDYLRMRFVDTNLESVVINGKDSMTIEQDTNGYYVDILKSTYASANKIYVKATDTCGTSTVCMTHVNDDDYFIAISSSIMNSYDFKIVKTADGEHGIKVTLDFGKKQVNDDLAVTFKLFDGMSQDDLKVFNGDKKGNKTTTELLVTAENGYVTINPSVFGVNKNYSATFYVESASYNNQTSSESSSSSEISTSEVPSSEISSPVVSSSETTSIISSSSAAQPSSSEVEPAPTKSGCFGSIVATSGIISILSIVGVVLLSKKKHD